MNRHLSRGSLFVVLMAALMTGAGALAGPVAAVSKVHFSPVELLQAADALFGNQLVLSGVEAVTGSRSRVSAGSDGRVTVLMVGSDHRDGKLNGERTDTMMVMSLNTANHQISAVNLPRDAARVPLAPSLGGGIFFSKMNGMLKQFKKQSGGSRAAGMAKLRTEIAWLLNIQIDYVAYIRFNGFDALVDQAGGVTTDIPQEIRDISYEDAPGYPVGAKFPAANNYFLGGASATHCVGGYPKPVTDWSDSNVPPCHRALVYVRSRHGTVGGAPNSDFKREARQQQFVFDTLHEVANDQIATAQGIRVKANLIPNDFYTTIPITSPSDGVDLYNLVQGATMPNGNNVILTPPTYSTQVNVHYELKLTAIRALCDQLFGTAV